MSYKKFTTEFINLASFKLVEIRKENGRWVATMDPKQLRYKCPVCGRYTHNHERSKVRTLRHRFTPGWGTLHVRVPVYRQHCDQCNITFTVEWEGIPPGRCIATQSYMDTAARACKGRDLKSVAREWGISYTTLERWYYKMAEKHLPEPEIHVPPDLVCMDDFAIKKGHKYAVALMDHRSGHVWHIEPGRARKQIQKALREWPFKPPTAVVVDMAPGMSETVKQVWPSTDVVIDKFHVLSLFFRKLNTHRKLAVDTPTKHRAIKYQHKLLTMQPEMLSDKEKYNLHILLSNDETLEVLYTALQDMRYVYESHNIKMGQNRFNDFVGKYLLGFCGAARQIARTLIRWEKEILNYFTYYATNGPMEGTNNLIKTLKRRAYGFRNMTRFSMRIRLECRQPYQIQMASPNAIAA